MDGEEMEEKRESEGRDDVLVNGTESGEGDRGLIRVFFVCLKTMKKEKKERDQSTGSVDPINA